jgi:hypothetical protein
MTMNPRSVSAAFARSAEAQHWRAAISTVARPMTAGQSRRTEMARPVQESNEFPPMLDGIAIAARRHGGPEGAVGGWTSGQ